MKKIMLILLTFIASKAMASSHDLDEYRTMMGTAYKNESAAKEFYTNTRNITSNSSALLLGFKGISELMMCNHVVNPFTKLSFFKKGKNLLEQALVKEPNNPELRFMRFCTQVNTPSVLAYNTDLKQDKTFLLNYIRSQEKTTPKQDENLYKHIIIFLKESKYCSSEEKLYLNNL
jgi:hypothetical protein